MLKRGGRADVTKTNATAHPCRLSITCPSCSSTLLIRPVPSRGGLPARLAGRSERLVEQPKHAAAVGSPQLFKMSAHKCYCAVIGCKASEKNAQVYHHVKKQAAASVATTHQALRIAQVKMHLCLADDILLNSLSQENQRIWNLLDSKMFLKANAIMNDTAPSLHVDIAPKRGFWQ